jgi:F0F1-type ATP synthase membrane subunit b/b'
MRDLSAAIVMLADAIDATLAGGPSEEVSELTQQARELARLYEQAITEQAREESERLKSLGH